MFIVYVTYHLYQFEGMLLGTTTLCDSFFCVQFLVNLKYIRVSKFNLQINILC